MSAAAWKDQHQSQAGREAKHEIKTSAPVKTVWDHLRGDVVVIDTQFHQEICKN